MDRNFFFIFQYLIIHFNYLLYLLYFYFIFVVNVIGYGRIDEHIKRIKHAINDNILIQSYLIRNFIEARLRVYLFKAIFFVQLHIFEIFIHEIRAYAQLSNCLIDQRVFCIYK